MGTNYYVTLPKQCLDPCPHCAEENGLRVHLGKSSIGWTFMFKAEDHWTPDNAFDLWIERAQAGRIEDETGQETSFASLLAIVCRKVNGKVHALEFSDGGRSFVSTEGHSFTRGVFF